MVSANIKNIYLYYIRERTDGTKKPTNGKIRATNKKLEFRRQLIKFVHHFGKIHEGLPDNSYICAAARRLSHSLPTLGRAGRICPHPADHNDDSADLSEEAEIPERHQLRHSFRQPRRLSSGHRHSYGDCQDGDAGNGHISPLHLHHHRSRGLDHTGPEPSLFPGDEPRQGNEDVDGDCHSGGLSYQNRPVSLLQEGCLQHLEGNGGSALLPQLILRDDPARGAGDGGIRDSGAAKRPQREGKTPSRAVPLPETQPAGQSAFPLQFPQRAGLPGE